MLQYRSAKYVVVAMLGKKCTVLEIHFWSVKCTVVTRLRENFEQLFIPIQATQGDYNVLM